MLYPHRVGASVVYGIVREIAMQSEFFDDRCAVRLQHWPEAAIGFPWFALEPATGPSAEWEEQQEFWPLIQNLHATPALSSEKPGTTMLPLYAQQSVHKLTEKFTGA